MLITMPITLEYQYYNNLSEKNYLSYRKFYSFGPFSHKYYMVNVY